MKLFFDLDGTLLDSKVRLFNLFCFLVPDSKFSFEEYWNLKRNAIGHEQILKKYFGFDESKLNDFLEKWKKLIEAPEWIIHDKPFEGITEKLNALQKNNTLVIVTARQNREVVLQQIQQFNWEHLFKNILVTEQKIEKEYLVLNNESISNNDYLIGDTGKDIQAGKFLGIKTIGVLSGFRNEENLKKYNPDIIVDSVNSLNL